MKIVFAASEAVPFCKTGGLADVAHALPSVLARQGHQVSLFLPYYRDLNLKKFQVETIPGLHPVIFQGGTPVFSLKKTTLAPRLTAYFIEFDAYFGRDGLYGYEGGSADFIDNGLRFGFFCKAVLESLKVLGEAPDVIHSHDWQTGLIPAFLKNLYFRDPFYAKIATVFTIHNMGYLGWSEPWTLAAEGFPSTPAFLSQVQYQSGVSLLRAGINFSDWVNTVSPTYKKEISTRSEFGHGLQADLRRKKRRFVGILNGIDKDAWNPASDSFLARPFDAKSLGQRADNKKKLLSLLDPTLSPETPVAGFVGRLDKQKGIETVISCVKKFAPTGVRFFILGRGNPDYQRRLSALSGIYKKKVHYEYEFSEPLAHLIYGGSDLFLMPSRFEPCGLGQIIAMRYGAVPVVSPTGGLKDTVQNASGGKGTGFVARGRAPRDFVAAFQKGLTLLSSDKKWRALQHRAMDMDFSWKQSVKKYVGVYEKAVREKK